MVQSCSTAMLMWEVSPMVAGGSWTACYHLVRNLRARQIDVRPITPWHAANVDPDPFCCEVEAEHLGVLDRAHRPADPKAAGRASPYEGWADAASPYDAPIWADPYGGEDPRADPEPDPYAVGPHDPESDRGAYGGAGGSHAASAFAAHVVEHVRKTQPTLIHAHDWITFPAALAAARSAGIPWIAHFHSTERDRRSVAPSPAIERLERAGAHAASRIVTPSRITAQRVAKQYGVSLAKIVVVPNVLSREASRASRGRFQTRRVVFLGRLEHQKAPDRFAAIAHRAKRSGERLRFAMFGDGRFRARMARDAPVEVCGPLHWHRREDAFDGASALLLPSRAEPFGMVVLEAMQCGVPVLYSDEAGVAEVIGSGIPIQASDIEATTDRLLALLADRDTWASAVQAQVREVASYPERGYESAVADLYAALSA